MRGIFLCALTVDGQSCAMFFLHHTCLMIGSWTHGWSAWSSLWWYHIIVTTERWRFWYWGQPIWESLRRFEKRWPIRVIEWSCNTGYRRITSAYASYSLLACIGIHIVLQKVKSNFDSHWHFVSVSLISQ